MWRFESSIPGVVLVLKVDVFCFESNVWVFLGGLLCWWIFIWGFLEWGMGMEAPGDFLEV